MVAEKPERHWMPNWTARDLAGLFILSAVLSGFEVPERVKRSIMPGTSAAEASALNEQDIRQELRLLRSEVAEIHTRVVRIETKMEK